MFVTDYYVLAVAINSTVLSLYELNCASNTWTATKIVDLGTISGINKISIAPFERYYILSASGYNASDELSVNMYQRIPSASAGTSAVSVIAAPSFPLGMAVCNYKNQIIVGGLKTNNIKWQHLGSCAVAYSGIGNTTFDPEEDPSSGFIKLPWDIKKQGKVYEIRRLGDSVIVYGNGGISRLVPFSNETIVGFGREDVQEGGVLGYNTMAGGDKIHCFINYDKEVCLLTDKLEVLGYKKYINTLTASKIIMSYEPGRGFFYISDGVYCYVLTPNGMFSTNQCVSSIGRYNNILCGFFKDNSDTYIRAVTSGYDLNFQGFKTIESVEAGIHYNTTTKIQLQGRISAQYDYQNDYKDLSWTLLNLQGGLSQRATGRRFKIGIRGVYDSTGTVEFNSLRAEIQFPDQRNRRSRL
jgi:hypothetical protein